MGALVAGEGYAMERELSGQGQGCHSAIVEVGGRILILLSDASTVSITV